MAIAFAIGFGYLTLGGLARLAISVGLLSDAALVIGSIAFAGYIAVIVVAFMARHWILQRTQPAWAERPLIPLALGLIVYVLLTAIPWLGTLIGLLVTLLALGALWEWGRAVFHRMRPTSTPLVGLQPA